MTIQSQINQLKLNFPGHNDVIPRIGSLYCPKSTLAQISAAGFLDNYIKTQNTVVYANDFIAAVGSDGHQWFKPVFTNGSCQLTVLP
jgi:hypothetical protein